MKKIFSLLLAIILCLSLCACNKVNDEPEQTTEPERMTEQEQQLFNYIIKITSSSFVDPSTVRVMSIGDYLERSKNEVDSRDYGPDTIVVKLIGTSIDTGVPNPHYRICLTSTKNNGSYAQRETSIYYAQKAIGGDLNVVNNAINEIMEYQGEPGDFVELSLQYSIKTISDNFDIKKINTAIAEHWEDLGM